METTSPLLPGGFTHPVRAPRNKKTIGLIILTLLAVASLSGCITMTDFESSQDYTSDAVGSLDLQTTLGQSFVSRRPELNSITIWLTRIPSISGNLSPENANILAVSLYLAPGDPKPIYASTIAIPPKGDKLPITISLPNQKNHDSQSYYLQLSNSSGTIQLNGRAEDIYPLGQAYRNGQPLNADLAFRLTYDYSFSSLYQDITSSFASFWLIFPILAVLWLPGWLLRCTGRSPPRTL